MLAYDASTLATIGHSSWWGAAAVQSYFTFGKIGHTPKMVSQIPWWQVESPRVRAAKYHEVPKPVLVTVDNQQSCSSGAGTGTGTARKVNKVVALFST